jgi:hypothetical protein
VKVDPVVAGHTQADQRKYLTAVLASLLPTHPVVHIPAAGQFSLATVALAAGYEPGNIRCSDISLYSGLIGSLIDPEAEVPAYRLSETDEELCTGTPLHRAAVLMYVMKREQLGMAEHLADQLEDLEDNRDRHIAVIEDKLEKQVISLKGVRYRHRGLPEVIGEPKPAGEVTLVAKPLYAGKPVKGFAYGDGIVYDPHCEPFNWSRDFGVLYEASKLSAGPTFWYWDKSTASFPAEEVVFSKEYRPGREEYWLCTKPEGVLRSIATFHRQPFEAYPLPVWGLDDELRPDSVIRFVTVNQNVELYYRDIWAHRLGATAGDRYMLMIVDDKVFAAVILQLSAFAHLKSQWIFEQSGFSAVSTRYKRMVRLLMWCVTCRQWGDDVMRLSFKQNRYYDPIGCETTCLSKYRKMKGNLGILKDRFRVKMPNGLYRIIQNAEFREETYTECIARFLAEQED